MTATARRPAGRGTETKHVTTTASLKARGDEGTVEAVFSTFGVVDRDGDVVLASAFTDGQPAPLVWAHSSSSVLIWYIELEANRMPYGM